MKILKLRFKNLNSLAGEWEIDFSSPQYTSEGIFAITGPTGAGKSTILDAICLGLYGKTPRLKNITASENEIMSRKTGTCYAEVFFESQKGVFRTHWSQRRSRDKASGILQSPRFEISDETTDKIIESQLSKTPKVIEELTGMDFNRFTQAMMLAQGSFVAFLQASENDRASMLEDITGTEIYSELSKLTFERNKAEKDKLHEMQLRVEGIKTLTEVEILAFEKENNENQQLIQLKNKDKKIVDDALLWLQQIVNFTSELHRLESAKTTNETSIIDFAPKQTCLNKAQKASDLEADFVQLQADRKAIAANIQESKTIAENIPQLEKNSNNSINELKNKLVEQQTVAKNAEAERETLKYVRKMDVLIAEKKKTATELYESKNNVEKQRNELDKKIADFSNLIQKSNDELQTTSEYLAKHKADEALQEEAPALKAKIETVYHYNSNCSHA
jgi:exonuclease SbcC